MTDSEKGERPERGARPAFAADFPRDPELDALVQAFDAGDFARVRRGAPKLLASPGSDAAVKSAAETLLARTRPDPLAALLVVISALLLIVLSAWWIAHDGRHP